MNRRHYHARDVLVFFALFVSAIFLIGCSSYGPKTKVVTTTTTDAAGVKTVTQEIEGSQSALLQMEALSAQKEIAAKQSEVEKAKLAMIQQNRCVMPAMPEFKGVGDAAAYYELINDSLEKCYQTQQSWAMAYMGAESSRAIHIAAGEGDSMTRLAEEYVQVGVAAEQASASKHGAWGKVVVAGVGIWGLTNVAGAWANAAANAGPTLFAANGARLNYSNSGNPSQYKDGIDLAIIGDKSTAPASSGVPSTGSTSTTNSASGDNEGDISIQGSPIFFQSKDFRFTNVEPQGILQESNATLSIPNNSNDNNAFSGSAISGTTDNNASSPNR